MAFEFIYSETAVSGSADVYNRLLSLNDRNDVKRFCSEIRCKAAGGTMAVLNRQRELAEIEKRGIDEFSAGRYEEAYTTCQQACSLIGDFNAGILRQTIETLIALERCQEAVALAYHGNYVYAGDENRPFDKLQDQAYSKLGYRDTLFDVLDMLPPGLRSQIPRHVKQEMASGGGRPFDDADFQASLDKLFKLTEPKTSWDENLYLVTHLLQHLQLKRSIHPSHFNFVHKIEANPTLMALFSRANFLTSSPAELRFLSWFMKFIFSSHMSIDPSSARGYLQRPWYRKFVAQFATSLVQKASFEKVALTDVGGSFDILLTTFFMFCHPQYQSEDGGLVSPLDDFSWYCNAISLVLFRDRPLLGHDHDAMFDHSTSLSRLLSSIATNSNFTKNLAAMTKADYAKSMDVLLSILAVNFAEFKSWLVRGKASDDQKVKPMTSLKMMSVMPGDLLLLVLSSLATKKEKQSFVLDQVSFFVHFSARLDYLSRFLANNKINDDGRRQLEASLTAISLGSCSDFREPYRALAECKEFSDRFGPSVLKSFSEVSKICYGGRCSEEKSKLTVELVVNLAAVSRKCPFSVQLFSQNGLQFHLYVLEGFMSKLSSISCRTPALILREANDNCRRLWMTSHSNLFHRLAVFLLDVILTNPSSVVIDEWIDLITSFHSICLRKPEIVSLDAVIKAALKRHKNPIELLLARMVRFVNRPVYAIGCVKWKNHAKDERLTPVFSKMLALVAGIVIATVTERNKQMLSLLTGTEAKTRQTVATEMASLLWSFVM